jgi:hypothetical protein
MRNTSSVHVAQYGCDAIYFLTRNSVDSVYYQAKFGQYNACEYVAKALSKYQEIDIVAAACFRAIVVLAKNNPVHSTKFGNLGACASISECLRSFPSSAEIAKWGCRCVAVLSEDNSTNISRFTSAGVCEAIPVSMQVSVTS